MAIQVGTSSSAIAVLIPCYNGEKFIRRSLTSVVGQSLLPAEILVIDDGSTDRTRQIIAEEFGAQVQVLGQQKGGPARARNAGIEATRSPLIAFLDADDWWEPGKLAAQAALMDRHPEAVANYTSMRLFNDAGQHLGDTAITPPPALWPRLRWANINIPPSCVMVRRTALEAIGGFNERQVGSEDWHLMFRLRELGPFTTCSEPLTDYRLSSGGLSGNATHMFNDFMQMLDDTLLSGLAGREREQWRRRIISYQAYRACLTARGAGEHQKELEFMKLSLSTWPSPTWAPERFKAFAVTLLRARQKVAEGIMKA